MKIVVFGSQRRVGLWEGDTVVDVNNAAAAYLSLQMSDSEAEAKGRLSPHRRISQAFIAAGTQALELARRGANHVKSSKDGSLVLPISLVKLRAPWPPPPYLFAPPSLRTTCRRRPNELRQSDDPQGCRRDDPQARSGGFHQDAR